MDGGNLAPLLQRRFLTAPYPLLNIGIENLQKQICSNDGNLAPPQTEQLSILKRGCGDASSSHRRCLLCRWCKISSIHRLHADWMYLAKTYRCALGPWLSLDVRDPHTHPTTYKEARNLRFPSIFIANN